MKIQISLSAKQVGVLYHKTTGSALLNILRSGKLELSTGRGLSVEGPLSSNKTFFASFTRSRFGGYHFREGGRTSNYSADILVTVDGTALSARHKLLPVDYWQRRGDTDENAASGKEVEERLVSNRAEIDILRYITRVDFVQNAVHGQVERYGFDKGKFVLVPNDRQQRALASILLQLKKHKIQYGFFDNMKDWALKRGEYSYTGPKGVSVVGPVTYNMASVGSYKAMQTLIRALSDTPFADLDKAAKDVCEQLYRYPTDVASVFNDYENYRKPDSPSAHRALAKKLSRMLLRRGFTTKAEAGKYLADKAAANYAAEQQRRATELAQQAAPLLVAALTKPVADWPTHQNQNIDPGTVFLGLTSRFGYMFDEAVRMVQSVLSTDTPQVVQLRTVMREMHLDSAEDVVSNVYYSKVRN